ncbi:MAG: hypothetical protein J6N15_05390 [Ruminiclostridium sp.]|nr:hypothetical protein [Ruminiclostridium sp.]
MKLKKILAAAAAAAIAVSALAVNAVAYDLNKDLKIGWSVSTTVPAEEFEEATPDSVWTLTFTVDETLAEKDGHNYWCVKPMINDTGWPFIDTLVGPGLSEGKDSYPVEVGQTEMKFTIPAEELEHLQTAGMAFMGHGVTLGTLTFSNDETLPAPAAAEPAADAEAAQETTTAAATTSNPATGVEDLAGLTMAALVSGGVAFLARKRRA